MASRPLVKLCGCLSVFKCFVTSELPVSIWTQLSNQSSFCAYKFSFDNTNNTLQKALQGLHTSRVIQTDISSSLYRNSLLAYEWYRNSLLVSFCLSGIYLTIVMAITSVSVILTVFVLNLHYRGPDDTPVPQWIRRLFLRKPIKRGFCFTKNSPFVDEYLSDSNSR